MDNKNDNIVARILQYIEKKDISIRLFAKTVGFSHSLLPKTNSLGSDKLEKIFSIYTDLNPTWVVTGKGNMLIETLSIVEEDQVSYMKSCKDCKEKERKIEILEKTITLLEDQVEESKKYRELIGELLNRDKLNKQVS
jgi:hypothetical protein